MWQKFIDSYFIPLFLRECPKELGDAFTCRENFHLVFYCTDLKPRHSEYQSAPVTIQEMLLEMFIDASQSSLRWLSIRAGKKLEHPSWSVRMGKEFAIFAFVIDISEPCIFSSIQEGTPPTSFGRRSLIPSTRSFSCIFLAIFHCFYLYYLLTY